MAAQSKLRAMRSSVFWLAESSPFNCWTAVLHESRYLLRRSNVGRNYPGLFRDSGVGLPVRRDAWLAESVCLHSGPEFVESSNISQMCRTVLRSAKVSLYD